METLPDWTADELRAFEADIAAEFNAGHIRAPIHLAGGNEEQLIKIFREVKPYDWCFIQWRGHIHCLLKGVPPGELKQAIMEERSISLCFPKYRIVASAIAGGHLPMALGAAWQIKRQNGTGKVWAFMGDMVSMMGIAQECIHYSHTHELPIKWVIEDNNKSVVTDTRVVWGGWLPHCAGDANEKPYPNVSSYRYDLPWPHSGAGVRVNF